MKTKSIKKNILMSVIHTTANFVFPILTYSHVAHILLPRGVGKVAFVYSILTYFSYIALLGIPTYGLREIAKVRDDKVAMSQLVQEILIINLISTMISYALLIIVVVGIPKLYGEKKLFLIMCGIILFSTLGMEWIYQAIEDYSYIAIKTIIVKSTTMAMTYLLIRTEDDVFRYGFIQLFAVFATQVPNVLRVGQIIQFRKIKSYNLKKHLKPIFVLFAASIAITVYSNFDVTMIGFMSSEVEVGLYNSAQKIRFIILSLSTAVTAVLIPRMSYYLKENNEEKVFSLVEKSVRISMILAIPVAVFVFIFGNECLELLCGKEYLYALGALRILIVCLVPLIISNLFGNQILIPSGNEKRFSQSVFCGLCINVLFNSILIPLYGAVGAAIGTLITECWNALWLSGGAKKYRNKIIEDVSFGKYIVALVLASVGSILVTHLMLFGLLFKLTISFMVFIAIYYLVLIIMREPLVWSELCIIGKKIRGMYNS